MLVHNHLIESAYRHPDKTALVSGDQRLSYAELDRRINQLARALIDRGIRRGDRVIVFLPNSIDTAIAIFGILKAGAVFVPLNQGIKKDKISYTAGNCGARALITDAKGIRTVGAGAAAVDPVSTAVVGVPDETLGQAIKAYVVKSDPALTEKQVRRHCTARLEGFMVPQYVEFTARLARTSSGKIDRKGLVVQHV